MVKERAGPNLRFTFFIWPKQRKSGFTSCFNERWDLSLHMHSINSILIVFFQHIKKNVPCCWSELKNECLLLVVGLRWRRRRWMAPLAWCFLATAFHLVTETILIYLCGNSFLNPQCILLVLDFLVCILLFRRL